MDQQSAEYVINKCFECEPLNVPSRGTIHISRVWFPDVFIALWMKRHIILVISLGICGTSSKEPAYRYRICETRVRSLGLEDSLEEEMVTYSIFLAWRIPWTEEPDGLQFMGLQSQTRLSDVAHSTHMF